MKKTSQLIAAGIVALSLGGCATSDPVASEPVILEPILDYQEVQDPSELAAEAFDECNNAAMKHHKLAASQANAALYFTAANALSACVAEASFDATTLAQKDVMQAGALAVLSYIKSGDIAGATQALDVFEQFYPEHDLYLANGASFVDSTRLLLEGSDVKVHSLVNAGETLKSEMRRNQYWETH